jgi:hypothetical protein
MGHDLSDQVFPSRAIDGHLGLDGLVGIVVKTIGRHLILHNLRRTFRSIAEATGVTEYQRKWLINHSTKNDVDLS